MTRRLSCNTSPSDSGHGETRAAHVWQRARLPFSASEGLQRAHTSAKQSLVHAGKRASFICELHSRQPAGIGGVRVGASPRLSCCSCSSLETGSLDGMGSGMYSVEISPEPVCRRRLKRGLGSGPSLWPSLSMQSACCVEVAEGIVAPKLVERVNSGPIIIENGVTPTHHPRLKIRFHFRNHK